MRTWGKQWGRLRGAAIKGSLAILRQLGRKTLDGLVTLGRANLFLLYVLPQLPGLLHRPRLLLEQIYRVGFLSLIVIVVSGFFIGMVLGLQGYNTLVNFGAEQSLGMLVALSLTRELGPVVTALLFAGRAGSAMTAEISLMKSTEQLDAMEMMAVDPLQRVIGPRLLAGIFCMPLLAAIFSSVGICGGYFIGVGLLNVDEGTFWSQMQSAVKLYEDVGNGVVKSIVFGFVVSWIAVFKGYDSVPTAAGIGSATTQTVVISCLAVLGLDYALTALMFS